VHRVTAVLNVQSPVAAVPHNARDDEI
jgi:hypothetical protein